MLDAMTAVSFIFIIIAAIICIPFALVALVVAAALVILALALALAVVLSPIIIIALIIFFVVRANKKKTAVETAAEVADAEAAEKTEE